MWNYGNYSGTELNIKKADAHIGSHPGPCDSDIQYLKELPYIKRQLKKIPPDSLRKELSEYGSWSLEELEDHEENLERWLWLSCGDIAERS